MTLFGISLQRNRWHTAGRSAPLSSLRGNPGTLTEVHPGLQARVTGFSSKLSSPRHAHLLSYGLIPGSVIKVIQHSPVTIVQVDQLELALERDLAREVQVAPIQ